MSTLISAPAAMEALGATQPETLVGRILPVPTEDGPVEYRLDEYLFQQNAFVATPMPGVPPPPFIVTVIIPNADSDTYEQAQDALRAAGIDTFEAHLQTPEQHVEHPPRSVTA